MVRYLIIFIIIIAIWSCSKNDESLISGSGTIEATEVVVSAAGTGEIAWLGTEEGMPVSKGDTLAIIDHEKLQIQLTLNYAQLKELDVSYAIAQKSRQNAVSQLENQQKKYLRIKALLDKESATQQQYDDIFTAYEIADTQLKSAINQLEIIDAKREQMRAATRLIMSQINDTKVQAPLSGMILKKYHEAGEFVVPGMALFRIADLSNVWIKIYVSEAQLGKVILNQKASIFIDSFPQQPFTGNVVWISPKAEFTPKNVQTQEARLDLVYAVKIEMENPEQKLKIGMPADVEIEIK